MKKTLIFILFICYNYGLSQQIVPAWFKKIPDPGNGINLAVGYTGKFRDKKLAKKVALNQARKNMAKQLRIRLIFEIKEMSDGHYRLIQPTFEQIYYENVQNYVDNCSFILDSAFVDDRYYILLATDEKFKVPGGGLATWGPKPVWTDNLPEEQEYAYGIGIVANYSYWKNGWRDADEYARFDACKNLEIRNSSIRTEKRTDEYTINRKVMRQSVDMAVANSKIIERWYDMQRDVYYSLCRIPISSNK
jgi:hypothetical protein